MSKSLKKGRTFHNKEIVNINIDYDTKAKWANKQFESNNVNGSREDSLKRDMNVSSTSDYNTASQEFMYKRR